MYRGGREGSDAHGLVPRLLELLRSYPKTRKPFIKHSEHVPTWVFLRWTSQLMAVVDRDEGWCVCVWDQMGARDISMCLGLAVVPLLERMAEEYPNAMR